jgi:hypothetical protein
MSILPPEVIAEIKQNIANAEASHKLAMAAINEAHSAGIDVTDARARADALKTQISQLKAVYGKQ